MPLAAQEASEAQLPNTCLQLLHLRAPVVAVGNKTLRRTQTTRYLQGQTGHAGVVKRSSNPKRSLNPAGVTGIHRQAHLVIHTRIEYQLQGTPGLFSPAAARHHLAVIGARQGLNVQAHPVDGVGGK